MREKYISIPEFAKLVGLSRVAVYHKVKRGQIVARKIGRNFAIPQKYVTAILGNVLSEKQKREIEKGVKKTVQDYSEALKLLGRE